ncbi:MAG: polysaccharide deacetylase family protein [Oscillospiraceae bacterium]|nr:polysaccharide deacetylase family protein [Oscillospiraceae bacterium]
MLMFLCIRLKKFLLCLAGVLIVLFGGTVLTAKGFEQAAVAADTSETVGVGEIFVPAVMYHCLLKDPARAGDYIVSPDVFEEDMRYLTENGYETVFVSDLINYVEKGIPLPEKPVLVTFDDGYLNVMTYAYPYMKENGLKGVMNVVGTYTDFSAEQDEHNPAYSSLTWDEIAELANSGVFEIGNHTYNMHSMTSRRGCKKLYNESAENYRKAMFDDIAMLQGLLSDKSGVTPVTFAYPFGFVSEDSVDILRDMGFKALLTCNEKPNYISRGDYECLLSINRYNRPAGISTEDFMEKLLKH